MQMRQQERAPLRHGHNRAHRPSREYLSWRSMLKRCGPDRDPSYIGVVVCDRWLGFENFLADMGPRPAGMSLDRINNEKGYEPGNCRWATAQQQSENRRNVVMVSLRGESRSIARWCRDIGLRVSAVRYRMRKGDAPLVAMHAVYAAEGDTSGLAGYYLEGGPHKAGEAK